MLSILFRELREKEALSLTRDNLANESPATIVMISAPGTNIKFFVNSKLLSGALRRLHTICGRPLPEDHAKAMIASCQVIHHEVEDGDELAALADHYDSIELHSLKLCTGALPCNLPEDDFALLVASYLTTTGMEEIFREVIFAHEIKEQFKRKWEEKFGTDAFPGATWGKTSTSPVQISV